MKDFKNIEEVLQYVNHLIKIDDGNVGIEDIEEFNKFIKFSPERIANKFGLNELEFVKNLIVNHFE